MIVPTRILLILLINIITSRQLVQPRLDHRLKVAVRLVRTQRRGAAEAIEAIAHGDKNTSKVVGREIGSIKLPPGTTIGAIVREEQVIIAHSDTVIEANDHVILFLVDKKYINDVERLFQPSAFFFG